MSRIEKALERAVKMRESIQETVPQEPPVSPGSGTGPGSHCFEIRGGAVDPAGVDSHIVCIAEPRSSATEQYKKLRATILKATRNDNRNTLLVVSADAGEGKTITAINTAVALANGMDHTVLLVDADLRKPSIHRYLGLKPQAGLSDYLQGKVDIPDVLINTGIGKLVFLPAGNTSENSTELLSSQKMRGLIQDMKQRYKDRYVIIDTSPILLTADPISLCNYMDGVIFVVRADHTSPKVVSRALSLIKGSTILGVIFNNVPKYLAKSHYPYYYRYGAAGYGYGETPQGKRDDHAAPR